MSLVLWSAVYVIFRMSNNTRKIVTNVSYGGFHLPPDVFTRYKELANQPELANDWLIRRDDEHLVQIAEELIAANKHVWTGCKLKIVEIPIWAKWNIVEYDGKEQVHEYHNIW